MSACSVTLYFHLGTLLPPCLLPRDPSHRRGTAGKGLSKEPVPGSALLAKGAGEGQGAAQLWEPWARHETHWDALDHTGGLCEQQGQQLELTCALRGCDQAIRCTWGWLRGVLGTPLPSC